MTIREDFAPYRDGNGLYAPNPVSPNEMRGSDNGPMYLSEVCLILKANGEFGPDLRNYFEYAISKCIDTELRRAPGDTAPDEIDDYLAVANAIINLEAEIKLPLPFRLYRFPQVIYAVRIANKKTSRWNPLDWCLASYSGLVILLACGNIPRWEADQRRLTWHLIQATQKQSMLCKWASNIWFAKLHSEFANGMRDVAGMYYQPLGLDNNPYSKYWVDQL